MSTHPVYLSPDTVYIGNCAITANNTDGIVFVDSCGCVLTQTEIQNFIDNYSGSGTGSNGTSGPTGPTGATGASVTFRGPYQPGVQYNVNDVVTYNNTTYICTSPPGFPNTFAGFNIANWGVLVENPAAILNFQGAYVPTNSYEINDVIAFTDNNTYVALTNVGIGYTPTNSIGYWQLFVKGGASSNGPTGATGPAGAITAFVFDCGGAFPTGPTGALPTFSCGFAV